MAVDFIIGKPGGGKTMWAVELVVEELLHGTREIVTNVALYPGIIWGFIRARYGVEVDLSRITFLNEDQTKHFFCHRGRGVVAPKPAEKKDGGDGRIEYANCVRSSTLADGTAVEERANAYMLPGVFYVLDEVHLHFSSRHWQNTGDSAMFYLSQHRKMSDDVILITQHPKQVDPALRRLAESFIKVTNLRNQRPLGVRMPEYFTVDTYPTEPSLMMSPMNTRVMKLDVIGLAACYNTAAGVGLRGQGADTKARKKGLPWQIAVCVVACILGGIGLIPRFVAKTMEVKAKPVAPSTNAVPATNIVVAPTVTNAPPPSSLAVRLPPVLQPLPRLGQTNAANVKAVPFAPAVEPPRIKWMVRKGETVSLGLHSGDTYTVGDGRMQIMGHFAVLDGNKIFRLPE